MGDMKVDIATRAPVGDALRGQLVGDRYRILESIVEGGMGVIYAAEHVALGRRVAVKVLPANRVNDAAARARFRAEAEIAAQVEHPHVVQVLDYGAMDDGAPYLAMELLRGESLASRLTRDGLPTWGETARLVAQIASGLMAVHEAGVVHRDLKPANVFLMEVAGQLPFVKLIDFGVSWRQPAGRRVTRPQVLVGTPLYMSPEQARGTREIDGRADQYALAVIAFEMLTGMRPFEADDLATLVDAIVREEPPRLADVDPTVPPGADAVMQRALSKEPHERFASVLDFAKALGAALQEGPLSIAPIESGVRLRRGLLGHDDTTVVGNDDVGEVTEPALAISLDDPSAAYLRLIRAPAAGDQDVSAEIAFIASRLEQGAATLSELLDVLPVPRRQALITVGEMIDRGMVEVLSPDAERLWAV